MTIERTWLYLSRADVEAIALPPREIIDAVELALREKALGKTQMPPKHWLTSGDERFFSAMTSVVPAVRAAACKWQSGSSANHGYGLPYITGLLILNDLETGVPIAVMDSTWLTAQRTAAATAVAARCLAPATPGVLGIIGCGVQARTNLEMLRQLFPDLLEVHAYDIIPEAVHRYAEEMAARYGARVRACTTARDAIRGSDIVVTCGPITATPERVGEAAWIKRGALIVTLDYDCYWKPQALRSADALYTDDLEQLRHLKDYGYFKGIEQVTGEIGDALLSPGPARRSELETIISINMGVAVEDVAVARLIYEAALEQGRGVRLPW